MFNLRLLFVALVWGVNFSVIKYALAEFLPLGFTVIRFFLAAIFLVAVIKRSRIPLSVLPEDRLAVAKLGFLGITLYNIFFMFGLKYTTAANSALLVSLSPLAGALIQAAWGKERITPRTACGLGLATLGVFLIIRSHHGAFRFTSSGTLGDLLTLGATLAWALYTISARPLLVKYPAATVTAYSMLAGSVLLLPAGIPDLLRQDWAAVSFLSWCALAFAAFIAAGVAYVFWYDGVKKIGVTRTMAYHYLMPFAAVLFAAVVLGESITLLKLAGGSAILLGLYLVQRKTEPGQARG
jgi:drug/metabolite transporter (DMT)-like permease